ncbi:hypothetical protein [Helicobacter felis]|uniref:hypothetical protein n=1 Tax=Helicobacter felis TaxID=214 RepID=UPI000CF13414|nr:hypothetical protein [Helicobacter felis]
MLRRNELLCALQAQLQAKIPAKVVLDDVLTLDVKKSPFLVLRTTETEIIPTASDTWKHCMSVELEIMGGGKGVVEQLFEEVLLQLEVFSANKLVKGVKTEKIEIAATPLYSLVLEFDLLFFTPSYRS